MEKKEQVYVVVDTPKKAKKLKKVLDMFGEELSETDELAIKTGSYNGSAKLYTEYNKVYFTGFNWYFSPNGYNKTKVSIKKLRSILAKEHLKVGDLIFTKYGELRFWNQTESNPNNFKRYATPEEIALLEGNKDKFAELKEAHKNREAIPFKINGNWKACRLPMWFEDVEYRIKPEEKPKVGDVVKAWDSESSAYTVGKVVKIGDKLGYFLQDDLWWDNAKVLSRQQAIDLLFN